MQAYFINLVVNFYLACLASLIDMDDLREVTAAPSAIERDFLKKARIQVLNANRIYIKMHNKKWSQGLVDYSLGETAHLHLQSTQFARIYLETRYTHNSSDSNLATKNRVNDILNISDDNQPLPAALDLTRNVSDLIIDQGSCGACYIVSTKYLIEMKVRQLLGKSIRFSLQHMIDCGGHFESFVGCLGGFGNYVIDFANKYGLVEAKDYSKAYQVRQTSCDKTFLNKNENSQKVIKADFKLKKLPVEMNKRLIKKALHKYGPILVAFDSFAADLQHYKSGVFPCPDVIQDPNHAVVIVGYGIDERSQKEYLKIANSLGKNWGEDGFFKIPIDNNWLYELEVIDQFCITIHNQIVCSQDQ